MEKLRKLFNRLRERIDTQEIKEYYFSFRYKGIIGIALIFFLITCILFTERSGIQYNYKNNELSFLPQSHIITKAEAAKKQKKDTLVLYNSKRKDSMELYKQFKTIFTDMKVGYKAYDASSDDFPAFSDYDAVAILLPDLTPFGERVIELCDYVKNGGQVLLGMTLERSAFSTVVESKIGIMDSSYENSVVDSIYVEKDFMIGGGRGFEIDDGYDSARALRLDENRVKIHAHTNDSRKLPLIWEADWGKGKFVVCNFGLYEKVMRGFFAAAYSLLGDACVYPVINASTFFLDDFPSQIPSGSNEYVFRDYGTSTRDFYINIWWPDMMNFADRYGIKYTGLAIECYDDAIDGTTDSAPDKGTFLNFGNMLLRQGGEIGYHGYNHQPLCLGNVDYKGEFDYKTWQNTKAMKSAFDELVDFCDELFPDVPMSVYVPPSNILSIEGRNFLIKEYPQIKTISGIYFEDAAVDVSCVQEFDVSKEGIVDQPRVVSGCKMENFMKLAVISELNLHFLNSHFTHPDDALDIERGAELGWEKLKFHFDEYLNWVYSSAPMIRNYTSSEASAAIQRFSSLGVKKEIKNNSINISLSGFYDEACLMVRINEGVPVRTKGGKLTHITGDLYLLDAKDDKITIRIEK